MGKEIRQREQKMAKSYGSQNLRREIGLGLLVFYGLGNILGAGIYVLVGEIVKISGYYTPLTFVVACVVVLFTAMSYAELSARFPLSAGEAIYVREGFGSERLALFTGLTIAMSGILSSATIMSGFYDYFALFVPWSKYPVTFSVLAVLTIIACWGIKESVRIAAAMTLIETAGLLMIIYVGMGAVSEDFVPAKLIPPLDPGIWEKMILGAFLAFYAFLGFEDMVNIAQEVKEPAQTMPRAILWVLLLSTLLYMGVAFVTVAVIPPPELTEPGAALAQVYERATSQKATILSLIAMVAVVNGALIQMIMVSRIFYGMAAKGWLPRFLGRVYAPTGTPVRATLLVSGLIALFIILLPLVELAEATSWLILIVFTLVNLALIRIKRRDPHPEGIRTVPVWVPYTAILLNLIMLGVQTANF